MYIHIYETGALLEISNRSLSTHSLHCRPLFMSSVFRCYEQTVPSNAVRLKPTSKQICSLLIEGHQFSLASMTFAVYLAFRVLNWAV